MKKNILITGWKGYVGATLIKYLKSQTNHKLIGYDYGYFTSDIIGINNVWDTDNLLDVNYFGDIRDFNEQIIINEQIDTIIHLSAISNDPMSNEFSEITDDVNFKSTIRLAELAKKNNVKNFIFASSCSVYGYAENGEVDENSQVNPLTPYAQSKLDSELKLSVLSNKNFKITCLRFATACGISDRLRLDLVLNDFVTSALINKKIEILSDGTPWRPLIDTVDMSRAINWAINKEGNDFEIVNVGSYNYQVKQLAEFIKEQLPETEIVINPNAAPDKRSYKVNFTKFQNLAPDYYPKITIQETILNLVNGLKDIKFNDVNFRKGNLIRLNKLNNLKQLNLINNNLKWIN
jgi:nucleoside-diphosphate-sugar epimerase